MVQIKLLCAVLLACGFLSAQLPPIQDENSSRVAAGDAPVFRVNVTARTAKAINYRHRGGSTTIDFKGTDRLPKARGEAKVESKQGYIEIEVEFDDLQPANRQGAEYLTYVLWAITPEGRTSNLGEVLLNGTKSKLNVTTELQVFGLVVTAEPYFAVTMPSDLIVMENVVRADTRGKVEEIEAKYELLQRGQYQSLANPLSMTLDSKVPLELYEARNAVQIARGFGADRYATETFKKAEASLAQAEAYQNRKAGKKPVTMTARQAVQTAEDSRAIAVKRQEEETLAAERTESAAREAQSESERIAAQQETDRISREADAARLLAQEKALEASADANRLKLENDSRMIAAQAAADRLKRQNEAQLAANQAELDAADRAKAQLEAEKAEMRSELLKQFNAVLETQDTARGLIVNMSDVLFDTGKYTLRGIAREKLAKVAGIVSGHPGLSLSVEGHTDNVGSDGYNQTLSENRGSAVRDFLVEQGMPATSLTAKGLGEAQPVATNDTAKGRQQNRRVEIVISGELIGTEIGKAIALK